MLRACLVILLVLLGVATVQAQDAPKLVKLVSVDTNAPKTTRQFFGHVVARETVDLAFQVSGQIVEIPIIEGEPVAKGALLAQLDLEPFQLALDQARLQKEQADRTLSRLEQLQGSSVSQVSVDDAETQAKLAEIAVRNAERSLEDATLTAPFDALVAARSQPNFSTVSAGTPIARLHDMSELRIEIDVPEVLFQRAGNDRDVELWAEFPAIDARYDVEPREFNAETSQVGQTFQITLGMAPPEDVVILPGASVTVYAVLNNGPASVRIPGSAVVNTQDGTPQVMTFTPDTDTEGTVTATPVEITPADDGSINVISGLEAGQEIVASGANLLSDGDRVRRFSGFSN
ncbi:efflux RND transporter periplasmic adaptor subunit [Cognatishimia sp. MH4019]|uniref:efflux RND transporter periplasmic adaptor subunit n=1 Tax=Cognatishimia sp. MH4019 TaxID=2854030 RepID=UPI001CD24CAE|nr:efflux RND transporter periplasmic adaptor subunit [Cognatishimia sp. MH4019]